MSVTPGQNEPEAVELPPTGDAAFATLMDTLVAEEAAAPSGTGGAEAGAAAAGNGQPAPAAQGTGAEAGAAAQPAAGAAGESAVQGGTPTAGDTGAAGAAKPEAGAADGAAATAGADATVAGSEGAGGPAGATGVDAAALVPELGKLSTALEEKVSKGYEAQAFSAVREEHKAYFEAIEKHPRLLVGQQVPAIGKEGTETLRDTQDAREWQEAVKTILEAEVKDRAAKSMEDSRDFIATVHSSIDLFKNNVDLIPGTKGFDRDLANAFAEVVKPYELRIDGKLQGYSIPVQPIINQVRARIVAERAAKPAAAAPVTSPSGAPAPGAGAAVAPPADPPQAGIQSKAGSSEQKEDFSTLFGTIGLPELQI